MMMKRNQSRIAMMKMRILSPAKGSKKEKSLRAISVMLCVSVVKLLGRTLTTEARSYTENHRDWFFRQTPKAGLTALAILCLFAGGSFGAKPMPSRSPSDQSEVRGAVQRIFSQLKAGQYEALYESLPSSSRSRLPRDRFVNALQ